MKVTILGNNSALPAFGRHPTAQTVSVHGEMLLIDCGEGTQAQMQRYSIKWRKLHHIFISHMHGDHYFGLPGLINSMSLMGRLEPLNLYGPKELMPIIEQVLLVADTVLSYQLNFYPLPDGTEVLVDHPMFTVTCFPVVHRIKCHGFMVASKTRGRRILPQQCLAHSIPVSFYENLKMGEDYVQPGGQVIKNYQLTEAGPAPKRYAYCSDTVFTDSFLHIC
jgi:ribonuclease Z